jgi:putative peptidoglycan lipid II flippase
VAGSAVEGGVVAYQVAWVFFLAPYAILAQPIHTAILPELVQEGRDADLARFRTSVRWALERMALFVLPVSAAMAALALPAMRVVSFGQASGGDSPVLLAAALASLAFGLFPYGAFLLLARAYYALGDSRTPGLVALATAVVGVVAMGIGVVVADGAARVATLGAAHSLAYALGALLLLVGLGRRVGDGLWPPAVLPMAVVAVVVGVAGWAVADRLLGPDPTRVVDLLVIGVVGAVGAGAVVLGHRALGVPRRLTQRPSGLAAPGPVEALP